MPFVSRRAVAVVLALTVAGCGTPPRRHSLLGDPTPIGGAVDAAPTTFPTSTSTTSTSTTTTSTTVAPTTTQTTLPPRPPRPYAVGTTIFDLTDPSRPTGSQPGRHLPSFVFYPTAGTNPGAETGAAPGLFHGWPLVVFAEGYNVKPLTYHDLIHHLASSGFVVIAPAFPLGTAGGPLDENDLQNQPGDIKFVISQAIAASGKPGLLSGMVDSSRIAVVGHSDGAEAALGVAFLPGQSDTRVGPVVSMAGQGILNGDHLMSAPVPHPLLVVQGSQDTINPPDRSDRLYASAPGPKAYLHLLGAGHLEPVADDNQWRPIVETSVVDWLDQYFGGANATGAGARLAHDGNVNGSAQVTVG